MNIRQAAHADFDTVKRITRDTIAEIYPRYYPKGAVDFFLEHHSDAEILADISASRVFLLEDAAPVGTVTLKEAELCRLFVLPAGQGNGYGSALLDFAERQVAGYSPVIHLDASLPAKAIYLKRGYQEVSSHVITTASGDYLCYDLMQKNVFPCAARINYENRVFVPRENSENGEVNEQTVFRYHQRGTTVWADYAGGEIERGSLIGIASAQGHLEFHYQHLNRSGRMRIGRCQSVPVFTPEGVLELHEDWQWLNGDCQAGSSVMTELQSKIHRNGR